MPGSIAVGDILIAIDAKPVTASTSAYRVNLSHSYLVDWLLESIFGTKNVTPNPAGAEDIATALSGDHGAPVWLEIRTAAGAAAKMVVLLRQPPLEPEPEQIVGRWSEAHASDDCLLAMY